jgi:SAM-dependent methyltransferase
MPRKRGLPGDTTVSADSGARLRSLYEPDGGVGEIFSSKVTDYAASRPDYPEALFDTLRAEADLSPGAVIADIGAGTGLLTQGLLQRGWRVIAVEPNGEMRAAADRRLGAQPNYRSVDGTAESMPIESSSIDLITAAQAFHWFEIEHARTECLRVLRPHGQVALIWNDRVPDDPLHAALDEPFAEYGGARRGALVAHEERRQVPEFFGAAPAEHSWPHQHRLDEAGLLSLVFSRSYMPERQSPAGLAASGAVRDVFSRYAAGGLVTVRYTSVAMVGRPR